MKKMTIATALLTLGLIFFLNKTAITASASTNTEGLKITANEQVRLTTKARIQNDDENEIEKENEDMEDDSRAHISPTIKPTATITPSITPTPSDTVSPTPTATQNATTVNQSEEGGEKSKNNMKTLLDSISEILQSLRKFFLTV